MVSKGFSRVSGNFYMGFYTLRRLLGNPGDGEELYSVSRRFSGFQESIKELPEGYKGDSWEGHANLMRV